jgi:tetratricopeptide (TPR) repeat protein
MLKSSIWIAVLTFFVTAQVSAQSYADAVKLFNEGFSLAKEGEREQSITKYITVVDIAKNLDDANAPELASKAKRQIPILQYKIAGDKLSQNDIDGAIDAMLLAKEYALKYESGISQKIASTVDQNIPKLYKKDAEMLYQQGEYEKAIEVNEKAIEYDSTYATAYYQLGQNYNKLSDNASGEEEVELLRKAEDNFDTAIRLAQKTNNSSIEKAAKSQLVGVLLIDGKEYFDSKNYQKAIEQYSRGLKYDNESVNLHFRLSETYNKVNNSQKALDHGKKALELENRGKSETAKIHYEIAVAQMKLGNRAEACGEFKQAAFGDLKNSAEYQMKFELECDKLAQN